MSAVGRRFAVAWIALTWLGAGDALPVTAQVTTARDEDATARIVAAQIERHTPRAAARSPRPSATPAALRVLYRVGRGAKVDLGWTGIAHGQSWPFGQPLAFDLTCAGGDGACAARAGAPGVLFGPPVPLSSGGIPVCIVNRLREAVTGQLHVSSACGELTLHLDSTVMLAQELAQPCPVCIGDRANLDGKKDGHCSGGVNDGGPCDVEGESVEFGATSTDCQPANSAIGTLPIDIDRLTTGQIILHASEKCGDERYSARCFCAGQTAPNACRTGNCALAKCTTGPMDGVCSGAPFRGCTPGADDTDCEARFAGAGRCETRPRPCFSEVIDMRGACDKRNATYVGTFCTPATSAPALNASAGLPGPARLILPLERVDPPSARTNHQARVKTSGGGRGAHRD